MRISLRELLIVVAIAAVCLAGLKFASTSMGTAVQAMTGLLLLAALVKAAVGKGLGRAFAIGFAVSAIAYYLVAYTDSATQHSSFSTGAFGTERALSALYPAVITHVWTNEATGRIVPNYQPLQASATTEVRAERDLTVVAAAAASTGDSAAADTAARGALGSADRRGQDRYRGPDPAELHSLNSELRFLNPQQVLEYFQLDAERRMEIRTVAASKEGLELILTGAPLAALKTVTYSRTEHPHFDDFRNVGFCLWTLLIGYIGGNAARFVYTRDLKRHTT